MNNAQKPLVNKTQLLVVCFLVPILLGVFAATICYLSGKDINHTATLAYLKQGFKSGFAMLLISAIAVDVINYLHKEGNK